jgi:hypothetical protein
VGVAQGLHAPIIAGLQTSGKDSPHCLRPPKRVILRTKAVLSIAPCTSALFVPARTHHLATPKVVPRVWIEACPHRARLMPFTGHSQCFPNPRLT